MGIMGIWNEFPVDTMSSNINEVIKAVLNFLFFSLGKDFARTKTTKSTKRHKDTRGKSTKHK